MVRYYLHAQPTKGSPCNASRLTPHASRLTPHASRKKYSVNKAFTLAETLIALGILGLIATFTIPKVMTEMTWVINKAR
jgi:prepilin-type N-terminal cleavage/methylation domain-containing protein